jgi:hypothetical protein
MNTFKLYDRVVLTKDLSGSVLKNGDVGTIVEVYDDVAYEIEFFALDGTTLAVKTVAANLIKPVTGNMVMHIRELVS